jgi:hypothetical protein
MTFNSLAILSLGISILAFGCAGNTQNDKKADKWKPTPVTVSETYSENDLPKFTVIKKDETKDHLFLDILVSEQTTKQSALYLAHFLHKKYVGKYDAVAIGIWDSERVCKEFHDLPNGDEAYLHFLVHVVSSYKKDPGEIVWMGKGRIDPTPQIQPSKTEAGKERENEPLQTRPALDDPKKPTSTEDSQKSTLVLMTKSPVRAGVTAWVEINSKRTTDWKVGQAEVRLELAPGTYRVTVKSYYKNVFHMIFDKNVSLAPQAVKTINVENQQ